MNTAYATKQAEKTAPEKKQNSKTDCLLPANQNEPFFNGYLIQRKATCACGGGCSGCQAKSSSLSISHPSDASEIEADEIADKVMRMSENESSSHQTEPKSFSENNEPIIQTKSAGDTALNSELSDEIASSQGGGSKLDGSTQSFMQRRFGTDFRNVKIHTDSNAVRLNRELNAHAFTVGNDIFFNEGKYAPETSAGKHLLAHELTHTLQQGRKIKSGGKKAIQRQVAVPIPAPIVIPFAVIALILAILALVAISVYAAYKLLMSKIAELITAVETVSDAIEEYIKNNPKDGMRCSTELIAFRTARDELLEALRSPARFGAIIIVRRLEAFKNAANALASCLGLPDFF